VCIFYFEFEIDFLNFRGGKIFYRGNGFWWGELFLDAEA